MQIAPATLSTFAEEIFLPPADAPLPGKPQSTLFSRISRSRLAPWDDPAYVSNIMAGTCKPNADAEVIRDKGSVAADGKFGFGQVVGMQATQFWTAERRRMGFAVLARNNHHLGRIGTYASGVPLKG